MEQRGGMVLKEEWKREVGGSELDPTQGMVMGVGEGELCDAGGGEVREMRVREGKEGKWWERRNSRRVCLGEGDKRRGIRGVREGNAMNSSPKSCVACWQLQLMSCPMGAILTSISELKRATIKSRRMPRGLACLLTTGPVQGVLPLSPHRAPLCVAPGPNFPAKSLRAGTRMSAPPPPFKARQWMAPRGCAAPFRSAAAP